MALENGGDANRNPERPRTRVSRPEVYWADHIITVVLALASGLALGALFDRHLIGDPIPWVPAAEAVALDGDTIRVSMLVHLDGMDAAEVDRERCAGERAIGLRARDRANELLGAGVVRVKILGQDEVGRIRAMLVAGDRPVARMMLRENLLQETEGAGRWCPDDARAAPDPVQQLMAFVGLL